MVRSAPALTCDFFITAVRAAAVLTVVVVAPKSQNQLWTFRIIFCGCFEHYLWLLFPGNTNLPVSGDQLSSIARCDCGEVNIENLHTNTRFRKGTHWRHQCNKSSFYRTGAHNEARYIVYQACKIANMDVDHEPPGLYKD